MSLSESDGVTIHAELTARGVNVDRECAECGGPDWHLADQIYSLRAVAYIEGEQPKQVGNALPVIAFACQNCGFVRFFNTKTFGFTPASSDNDAAS